MTVLSTDPICLALDPKTHDLIVPLRHARGIEAFRQGVDSRVNMIKGEVFFDLDAGVAWFPSESVGEDQAIMGQPFNEAKCRAELRKAILDTPAAYPRSLILNFTFAPGTRVLDVDYSVRAKFGDTIETVSDSLSLEV